MLEQRHYEMMDSLLIESLCAVTYNQVIYELVPSGHSLDQLLLGAERQVYNMEQLIREGRPLEYKDEDGEQQSIQSTELESHLKTILLTYVALTHQIKYGEPKKPEEPAVNITPPELSVRVKRYNDIIYKSLEEDAQVNEPLEDDFSYGFY